MHCTTFGLGQEAMAALQSSVLWVQSTSEASAAQTGQESHVQRQELQSGKAKVVCSRDEERLGPGPQELDPGHTPVSHPAAGERSFMSN